MLLAVEKVTDCEKVIGRVLFDPPFVHQMSVGLLLIKKSVYMPIVCFSC